MNDPYVSMELFNLGIAMEQPSTGTPEALTKEKTIELVKTSNDFAFERFKTKYMDQISQDPMLMPVLISAIAHDWVLKNHGFTANEAIAWLRIVRPGCVIGPQQVCVCVCVYVYLTYVCVYICIMCVCVCVIYI